MVQQDVTVYCAKCCEENIPDATRVLQADLMQTVEAGSVMFKLGQEKRAFARTLRLCYRQYVISAEFHTHTKNL